MSAVLDWLSVAAVVAGVFFFFAGTVALLRFPDSLTRLHALTKHYVILKNEACVRGWSRNRHGSYGSIGRSCDWESQARIIVIPARMRGLASS